MKLSRTAYLLLIVLRLLLAGKSWAQPVEASSAESDQVQTQPAPFWQREHEQHFSLRLQLETSPAARVYLCRNSVALQLHGASLPRSRLLQLRDCLFLPADIANLTQIIGRQSGDFVLLQQSATQTDDAPFAAEDADRIAAHGSPLQTKDCENRSWHLLNLHSDGEGVLVAELEALAMQGRAGAYSAGIAREIVLLRPPLRPAR
ncbi:MAG: hypothetical protein K1X75_14870 [Leptospirales bacterium]|nr:hypothetical protein [Leptospirales bacterium]